MDVLKLKLDSRNDRTLAWLAERRSVVDVSESGRGLTRGGNRLSGLRVGRSRVVHLRAVEDVREFHANAQVGPLFDTENSAQTHVFDRTALVAIVVIKRCC